jgi:hypothetical protein
VPQNRKGQLNPLQELYHSTYIAAATHTGNSHESHDHPTILSRICDDYRRFVLVIEFNEPPQNVITNKDSVLILLQTLQVYYSTDT